MFILIFEQLVKMFFIMLLAILCYKIKLVNQEGNKTVSNLLLLVVNPFVIITTYQTDYKPELVRGLLISFGAAVLCHIVGILVTTLLIRPKGSPDANIERYNAMYSNCGFIGIPLINSVLGSNGVFFLSAYIVVFNLVLLDPRSGSDGEKVFLGKCAKRTADPYGYCNTHRSSALFLPDPFSGCGAGFHELCCRYEHASGYDGRRFLGGADRYS